MAASRLSAGAWVGKHIRPPIIGIVLLRLRPQTLSNSLARCIVGVTQDFDLGSRRQNFAGDFDLLASQPLDLDL